MEGRLAGKVALITGGTSGIGAGTAARFVAEDARVVVAARSETRGQRLAHHLGAAARFHPTDVGREEEVAAAIRFTLEEFGRLDCLFNNAGAATAVGSVEAVTREEYRHHFDVLVGGVLWGMKHAGPVMRQQRTGSIINNTSIAGRQAGYGNVLYSAAKAAVIQMTRSVALQLAADGVRVNSISPGFVVTSIFGRAFGQEAERAEQTSAHLDELFARISPLGIAGQPEDVASAALFLASEESRYITGHDLVVDGGVTAGITPRESARVFGQVRAAIERDDAD